MLTQDLTPEIKEVKLDKNPNKVQLFIKRDDQLHPIISGNKWRKLRYNLVEAKKQGHHTLLTFGGAYSNHIHAAAGAAHEFGFKSIGVIRGEEHLPLNPTLQDAQEMGMRFRYMDRSTYREKHEEHIIEMLQEEFGDFYLVPEGGTNELALKGAAEIIEGHEDQYDYFCSACGTAGTATGMVIGLNGKANVLGFSVLKGNFHQNEVSKWLSRTGNTNLGNWKINTDYHFGGYAKFNWDLVSFINEFKEDQDIPLDPVYTGKMMFGVFDLISKGYFPEKSRILAIHTGGLQGISGFNQRFNNLIKI
ncbi:MAG: pyridoxal-phosphate dependent enzyme [Bacteroidota bacterium]